MKLSILYIVAPLGLSETTLAGMVATLGHGGVIGSLHFTPPCQSPCGSILLGLSLYTQFEGNSDLLNFGRSQPAPIQIILNTLHEGARGAETLPISNVILR